MLGGLAFVTLVKLLVALAGVVPPNFANVTLLSLGLDRDMLLAGVCAIVFSLAICDLFRNELLDKWLISDVE